VDRILRYEQEAAAKAVQEGRELLMRDGVEVSVAVLRGNPAARIVHAAEELSADLVVVGSKGLTGLEGFLMGSVARAVAHRCERPVLVARAPEHGLHDVVFATDGSEHAAHAVEFARRLPLPAAARQTVIHVVQPYRPVPDFLYIDRDEHRRTVAEIHKKQEELGAGVLTDARDRLAELGNSVATELRAGDPAAEILRVADERKADLIVAGARGVSWIEGLLLGSVADRLLKEARCSVLVVR
jgi:nucleotide-binding universal stress UspA family protein